MTSHYWILTTELLPKIALFPRLWLPKITTEQKGHLVVIWVSIEAKLGNQKVAMLSRVGKLIQGNGRKIWQCDWRRNAKANLMYKTLQFCFKHRKTVAFFQYGLKSFISHGKRKCNILQTTGLTKKTDGLTGIKTASDHWTVTATKTILLETPRKEMKMKANMPTWQGRRC